MQSLHDGWMDRLTDSLNIAPEEPLEGTTETVFTLY